MARLFESLAKRSCVLSKESDSVLKKKDSIIATYCIFIVLKLFLIFLFKLLLAS